MVRVPAVLSARIQIRQARAAAGLSQTELAQRIGVTQQQVANFESSDGDIRLGTLERAADALELTVDLRLRPKAA
jgi:transcriptional regulator with XRE-family HTH domain